jgi:hypothetical protein
MRSHTAQFTAIVVATAVLATLAVFSALCGEPPSRGNPGERVLLLQNGEVLQGTVSLSDGRYQVHVSGGEIDVKPSDVICCCRSLEEAYWQRLRLIQQDSAQARLELAQWCQRAGLAQHAAAELAQARSLDPSHPLIPLLERQLKLAAQNSERGVVAAKAVAGPTVHELDLMVRGMPPRTVEIFAQTIQPLLMNSCATAGCHGQPGGNKFQLFRIPVGTTSRRLTQRNLYATLDYLDWDNPMESRLITVPKRAHGTAKAPIFADRQLGQYRQLAAWCCRVAQVNDSVLQASYNEPFPSAAASKSGARKTEDGGRKTAAEPLAARPKKKGAADGSNRAGVGAELESDGAPRSRVDLARRQGARSPKDPFDPELFNQRFAPPDPPQLRKGRRAAEEAAPPDAPMPGGRE